MAANELTLQPVTKESVLDPLVSFPPGYTWIIHRGGPNYTFYPFTSSNYSQSNITWNIIPPNVNSVMDRYIIAEIEFEIDFTGPAPASGNLLQVNSGIFALRSYPINKIISSIQANYDGTAFSYLPADYMDALQWIMKAEPDTGMFQTTWPSLPDQSQNYDDLYQHSTNPLNPVGSGDYYQEGRGAFPMTIVSNTPTSAKLRVKVQEPLLLPPFSLNMKHEDLGLTYINNLKLQLQLGQLNRILSYNTVAGNALTSVSVSIISQPILHTLIATPPATIEIPPMVSYPYKDIFEYPTDNSANNIPSQRGTSDTFQINSNSVQLNYVPNQILIFAKRHLSDTQATNGYQYTDSFARLQAVTITFNNQSGLLSSASESDLWRLSVQNGLRMPWTKWVGAGMFGDSDPGESFAGVGSVLVLEPYKDLGLGADLASGVNGVQLNMQVKATFQNISSDTVSFTMFIVTILDGMLTVLQGGRAITQTEVISKEDVLTAPVKEITPLALENIVGGSFFGKIKSFFNKYKKPLISGALNQAQKAVSYVAPEAAIPASVGREAIKEITGYGYGKIPKNRRKKLALDMY